MPDQKAIATQQRRNMILEAIKRLSRIKSWVKQSDIPYAIAFTCSSNCVLITTVISPSARQTRASPNASAHLLLL